MKTETIAGLRLFYYPEEHEAAHLIQAACERSVPLICQRWGLPLPEDCRVYVMTSWPAFLFHAAPWLWRGLLALTLPLVARRASTIWPYAGGWALVFGRRRVVGVKPPRLLQTSNTNIGEQIFVAGLDPSDKVQSITCHELTHAFTFHLKLPTWLNEGLATLAMEHYLDRRIVREENLETLAAHPPARSGRGIPRVDNPQALITVYARGYWLTRFIEETRPELLRDLLSKRRGQKELEEKVASAFGKDRESFWKEIDGDLRSRFRQVKCPASPFVPVQTRGTARDFQTS